MIVKINGVDEELEKLQDIDYRAIIVRCIVAGATAQQVRMTVEGFMDSAIVEGLREKRKVD